MDFNIIIKGKNVVSLRFEIYQHQPKVAVTMEDKITANTLIKGFEPEIYFESKKTFVF